MDNAGTGEVLETGSLEEATAPGPIAFHRVDHPTHDHSESQESPKPHALGHSAGNDRHAGGGEHHLEEEIRALGVVRRTLATCSYQIDSMLVADQEPQVGQHAAGIAAVHQRIPEQQIHHACQGIEHNVLGEDFSGVLRPHQTGFEHGETRRHPHHQGAANQEVEGIECVLQRDKGCTVHATP
ncbi:hypothetical protein D9M68_674200 [compost metagenome]